MPNWCENELEVSGKADVLKLFMKLAKSEELELDFEAFAPYPEIYKRSIRKELDPGNQDGYNGYGLEKSDFLDGYGWCFANWGTKWNVDNPKLELTNDNKKLRYFFDTAWSPPKPLVLTMSRIFKTLVFTLRYWECGANFQGVFKVKGGEIIKNQEKQYRGDRGG